MFNIPLRLAGSGDHTVISEGLRDKAAYPKLSVRIWLETPVFLLIKPVPFYSAALPVNIVSSM